MSTEGQPEEILFRIRVDSDSARKEIIDFTKQIDEVKKAQSLLDAEYKKGNKTLAEHTSATVDNKIKLKELTAEVKIREKALEQQAKAEKTAADSCERLKVSLDGLRTAYGKLSDSEKEAASGQALKKQIDAQSAAYTQAIVKQNAAEQSTVGMRKAVVDLRKEYFLLSKEERKTAAGKELQKHIVEINEELTKTEKGVGVFGRSVGDYFGQLKGLFSSGGGIGGAISGLTSLIPGLGGVIGPVIGGLTSGLEETSKGIVQMRGEIQQLTGVVGSELDLVTAKIQTLNDVFQSDFTETLLAVNAMSKQFGISAVESLDLIEQGYLAGANASGNFLDSIKEYSVQFDDAGGKAEEFIAILTQNVKAGIFDDKGISTIKEGMISLREQTTATVAALKPLGEETNNAIKTAVDEGRFFDAIKLVSKGLNETAITAAEAGTIMADVFRGDGEDAGEDYLKTIYQINTAIKDQIDDTNQLVIRQREALAVTGEYNLAMQAVSKTMQGTSTSTGIFFTKMKTMGANFFVGFIRETKAFADSMVGVGKILKGVLNPFATTDEAISDIKEGFKQIFNNGKKMAEEAALDAKILADQEKATAETARLEAVKKEEDDRKKELAAKAKAEKEAALQSLKNQKAEIEIQLINAKAGSERQLKLKKELLQNELEAEKVANSLKGKELALATEKTTAETIKLDREAAEKRRDEANKSALRLLNDQKAALEVRLIDVEKGSEEELLLKEKLIRKQLQIEQTGHEQSANQKKLATRKAEEEVFKIKQEFAQKKVSEGFDNEEAELRESLAARLISQDEYEGKILDLERKRLDAQLKNEESKGKVSVELRKRLADNILAVSEREYQNSLKTGLKAFDEAEAALRESYRNNEVSTMEYNEYLATLAKGRVATELLINEKFNKDTSAQRQELADIDEESKDRQKANAEELSRAETDLYLTRIAIAQDTLAGFQDFLGKHTVLSKAFFAIQKGLAIAEVVVNLQAELQAIRKANSLYPEPFGTAVKVGASLAAGAKAAVSINTIQKQTVQSMEQGGIIPEEYSPQNKMAGGGVLHGPRHSQGGIQGTGRFSNVEVEGGEIVLTRGVKKDPRLFEMANILNIMAGGRNLKAGTYHAAGGIIDSALRLSLPKETRVALGGGNSNSAVELKELGKTLEKMPAPVVVWQDYKSMEKTAKFTEDRTNL